MCVPTSLDGKTNRKLIDDKFNWCKRELDIFYRNYDSTYFVKLFWRWAVEVFTYPLLVCTGRALIRGGGDFDAEGMQCTKPAPKPVPYHRY